MVVFRFKLKWFLKIVINGKIENIFLNLDIREFWKIYFILYIKNLL